MNLKKSEEGYIEVFGGGKERKGGNDLISKTKKEIICFLSFMDIFLRQY